MTTLIDIKSKLKSWIPQSNEDAAEMLYVLSSINNMEASLKKQCYDILDKNDHDYFSDSLNVRLKKVNRNIDIYNESEEVNNLIADIEVLKAKLKNAQLRAGINRTEVNTYYKIHHEI